MNIDKLINTAFADEEKRAFEGKTSVVYRMIVYVKGEAFMRRFPIREANDPYNDYTEQDVMSFVAEAKRKGLKPVLWREETHQKRLM